jgi:hypothetical protein
MWPTRECSQVSPYKPLDHGPSRHEAGEELCAGRDDPGDIVLHYTGHVAKSRPTRLRGSRNLAWGCFRRNADQEGAATSTGPAGDTALEIDLGSDSPRQELFVVRKLR